MKLITIQSKVDIMVTAGLMNDDVSNPDAHIPDRLKVNPTWPKYNVMIYEGQHTYPAEIANWNTVKSLVKHGIMTIGAEIESDESEQVNEVQHQQKQRRSKSLNELTEG